MAVDVGRLGWIGVVVGPLALLLAPLVGVVPDPVLASTALQVDVVALTSILALVLGLALLAVGRQIPDARVFFLSLAFLAVAGFFLVHGLTAPGLVLPGGDAWSGLSPRLGLLVGASFFAVGTVEWGAPIQRALAEHRSGVLRWFATSLIVYALVAVVSVLLSGLWGGIYDVDGVVSAALTPTVAWIVSDVTLVLLGVVILRHAFLYRLSRTPLAGGFLGGGVFLAQAQVALVLALPWHLSWWEYHGLVIAALLSVALGLGWEYGQTRNLSDVVQGLLIRDPLWQFQRGYTEVIFALIRAVEAKDPYTRGHTLRVSELAVAIGRELRLSPERLRILHQAALMHDIGKIGVSDAILNKAGHLTPEEFKAIKEHPVRGHLIISSVRSLRQEVAGVRHHHERLDGSGYPDGLVGDEIPLDARIIAVADMFDALTSPRAYRDAWPVKRALGLIDQEAGSKLDPRCVVALHRVLRSKDASPDAEVPELVPAEELVPGEELVLAEELVPADVAVGE